MMTLSQVNALAEQLDNDGLITEQSLEGAKGVEDIFGKICVIYQKIRPILEMITILVFIPKKWRTAVISLMAVLDGLCPDTELAANG